MGAVPGRMTSPHIPSWVEDVTAELAARYEAEAIFLAGSRARGLEAPVLPFELLVLVDNDNSEQRGMGIDARWESLEGFAGPVRYLRAALAELLAGAYAGGPRWRDLVVEAYALHDPLNYAETIARRRAQLPEPLLAGVLQAALRSADEAEAVAGRDPLASRAMTASAVGDITSATAQTLGHASDPPGIAAALRELGPGAQRAYSEAFTGEPAETLRRLVNVLESSLALRGFTP